MTSRNGTGLFIIFALSKIFAFELPSPFAEIVKVRTILVQR
jgi:hypothetical protein